MDLHVRAHGDLAVDSHHTVEDIGIVSVSYTHLDVYKRQFRYSLSCRRFKAFTVPAGVPLGKPVSSWIKPVTCQR